MPEHGINVFDIFDVAYEVIELFELFNRSYLFKLHDIIQVPVDNCRNY